MYMKISRYIPVAYVYRKGIYIYERYQYFLISLINNDSDVFLLPHLMTMCSL